MNFIEIDTLFNFEILYFYLLKQVSRKKKLSYIPFFLGPLHITASVELFNRNPIDISDKLSSMY